MPLPGLLILGLVNCKPTCLVINAKPLGVIKNLPILSASVTSLSACVIAPPLISPSVKVLIVVSKPGFPASMSIVGLVTKGSPLKPPLGLSNAVP